MTRPRPQKKAKRKAAKKRAARPSPAAQPKSKAPPRRAKKKAAPRKKAAAKKKAAPRAKRPPGRPSDYTPEAADRICAELATRLDGLKKICDGDDTLPAERTVYQWLYRHPEFAQKYARAREAQQHLRVDETIEIVDTKGDPAEKRLRFDQRRWMMGKLAPKVYGTVRVVSEHSGPGGGPVQMQHQQITPDMSDEEAAAAYRQLTRASGG